MGWNSTCRALEAEFQNGGIEFGGMVISEARYNTNARATKGNCDAAF